MSDSEPEREGEGERRPCGCRVGGLHRYACALVGHVDPPVFSVGDPEVMGARIAMAERAVESAGKHLAQILANPSIPHHSSSPVFAAAHNAQNALAEARAYMKGDYDSVVVDVAEHEAKTEDWCYLCKQGEHERCRASREARREAGARPRICACPEEVA